MTEMFFFDIEYSGLDLNGNRYVLKSKEAGLDYEEDNFREIEIVATDSDGLATRFKVEVSLKNVNEGKAATFGDDVNYKGPVWTSSEKDDYVANNQMSTEVKNLFAQI